MHHEHRIANPERYYKHPSAIIPDRELTELQRITALKNWRDDINLRLTASEENMLGNGTDPALIEEINDLLRGLEK